MLQPHQERMIDERIELAGRLGFLGDPKAELEDEDMMLMFQQSEEMLSYLRVLSFRISRFK